MFRYQILIEYVGTSFRGWQIQKKGKTIQGLIQEKISKILKEKIILFGSGRTDSGVHAIEQSAHFDCTNKIYQMNKFLKSINHFLFKDGVHQAATTETLCPRPKEPLISTWLELSFCLQIKWPVYLHGRSISFPKIIFSFEIFLVPLSVMLAPKSVCTSSLNSARVLKPT